MKLLDISGKKFGKLTALESVKVEVNNRKKTQWRCICECGKETVTTSSRLVSGTTKSCGCIKGVSKTYTKEKFIEKAVAKHGDKYDYGNVVYVKANIKIDISCNCGERISITPADHLQGGGCGICNRKNAADKLRMSCEEFVSKAESTHGVGKFDYTFADYRGAKNKVNIKCNTCGTMFTQEASAHMHGKGCKQCAVNAMADRCRDSKDDFIRKAKATHGEKYTYEKVQYKNAVTDVIVYCPTHGYFPTRPNHHINGSGCEKCGKDKLSTLFMKSQKQFIEEVKEVHKDKSYNYSKVNYTGAKNKITIHCEFHGDFDVNANSFLMGCGCASCANWGFDFNLPATLYVLQDLNITKVGITGRDVSKRISEINNSSGKNFKVLRTFEFDTGRECYEFETSLLNILNESYSSPKDKFDGYTECFYDVDLEILYSDIESILGATV